jgi:hypothetical protein
LQGALFALNLSCGNFLIFCRTEIRKNSTGEQKMRQKSSKKQQGHKKGYRNRKIRYWKTKKLTGEQKNGTGNNFRVRQTSHNGKFLAPNGKFNAHNGK